MTFLGSCSCGPVKVHAPARGVLSLTVQKVAHLPDKARIYPGSGQMQVDRGAWASWSRVERACAVAHELAHEEDPTGCEGCADERAGAILRHFGVSKDAAIAGFRKIVGGRRTTGSVSRGWDAADLSMAPRSLAYGPDGTIWDGGEVVGSVEDGQSMGEPASVDYGSGQSVGAPATSSPPRTRRTTPKAPATPAPTAPASSSRAPVAALAIAAAVAVGVFLFFRSR